MARVRVPMEVAKWVQSLQRDLIALGWEAPRFIVPGKGRMSSLRALSMWGEHDLVIEVKLKFARPRVVTVCCAARFGAASGQCWSSGSERPLPTPTEAKAFLQERCVRENPRSAVRGRGGLKEVLFR